MATLFEQEPTTPVNGVGPTAGQFVTFTCGNRNYGIDIMAVREIRSWSPTVALPGQPFGACGVLDIRGRIVQVYDLSTLLSIVGADANQSGVVLVVSLQHQDVGILADSVSDIIFAGPDDVRSIPRGGSGAISKLVKSDDRLIAILDLDHLFPDEFGAEKAYHSLD